MLSAKRRRTAVAAGFVLALSLSSTVRAQATQPETEEARRALQQVAEDAKKAPEIPKLEPPDGKWLRDEQGREYFLYEVTRYEGYYKWENEAHTRVRLAYGLVYDVASSDDKKFVVKLYRPSDESGPVVRRGTSEIVKAQIEKTYAFETPEAQRLDLKPYGNGLPTRGQWRHGVTVADMNGDGFLDIVHGPYRKGAPRPNIFLGDGKGNWRLWPIQFPAIPVDYGDVAVADLNGDGHLDLVLASHLRGVTALLGDGKGAFTAWTSGIDFRSPGEGSTTEAPFSSHAIRVQDIDGDGKPDVVVLGEGPRMAATRDINAASFSRGARGVRVYLNQGDGTWKLRKEAGDRVYGDTVVVADLNGDGHPDIITASSVQGVDTLIQMSKPDGSLQPVPLSTLRPKSIVNALAVADLDGDGHLDIVIGYLSYEGGVWRNGLDVEFARPSSDAPGGISWTRRALINRAGVDGFLAMDAGDIDGDGHPDLAAVTGDGKTWIFLADGKGWFTRERTVAAGLPGCTGQEVKIADLDKDGKGDLILGFASDPTSSDVFGLASGMAQPCASQGALQAWRTQLKR